MPHHRKLASLRIQLVKVNAPPYFADSSLFALRGFLIGSEAALTQAG